MKAFVIMISAFVYYVGIVLTFSLFRYLYQKDKLMFKQKIKSNIITNLIISFIWPISLIVYYGFIIVPVLFYDKILKKKLFKDKE